MTRFHLPVALAALAVASSAAAHDPAKSLPAPTAPRYPLHDVDEHGALWVRGRGYKARFDAGGATFVPYLGSRAPRNFPVTFTVAQATCGGAPLAVDGAAPPVRTGETIAFDRGALVEEYGIAADSIEQRFVFSELPARGAIVVSVDARTELTGRADAQGFRFENELGGVSYGRAFALDARGARCDVEARLVEGRIELAVPEAFVAGAALPLTIDPFVGNIQVDVDAGDDWQADVAYDATTNSFLVVYENVYSASDHDVYARKYVDQVLQGTATVDFTVEDWRNPKVSNNNLADHFLCVAQVGVAPNRIIRGRFVLAQTLGLGSVLTISGAETGDKWNPDTGGDTSPTGPTYHCVAWQNTDAGGDDDVHVRLVGTGGGFAGGTILLATTAVDDSFPSVSKTNGLQPLATQEWNLVWQHATTASDDDIQGARIRYDGVVTAAPFLVASTAENERTPAASPGLDDHGSGRPWLAAYTYAGGIRLRVFTGTLAVATTDLVPGGSLTSYGQPTLATDGGKWIYAHTSTTGVFPNFDTDLVGGTVAHVAGAFEFPESVVLASSGTLNETRPELASSHSATATGPWRNYVVYDTDPADHDVHAIVYDSPVNAGGYLYCNGDSIACPCANGNNGTYAFAGCASSVTQTGAHLESSGESSISLDTALLAVQGVPATTSCLFFQGTTATSAFFGDGARCAAGSVVRLGTKTAVAGASSYGYPGDVPIHVRGMVPAAGGWRYYQCWYRNAAAFCTASTFNLSNGAAMLWSP